jgi:hypothetical protein
MFGIRSPIMAKKKSTAKVKAASKITAKRTISAKPIAQSPNGTDLFQIESLPTKIMDSIITDITNAMNDFREISDNNLNALQRKRKIGAGIRNYGFIEKVSDLALVYPQFAQFFDPQDLKNCVHNVEILREIAIMLQSFARMITNAMLIYSDDGYGFSLIFYNLCKEMSKRGNPDAMELYKSLQIHFKKKHKNVSAEPTLKELEHDVHAVLHGKKDGVIEISGRSPKVIAGKRTIVDDVRKSTAKFKESEEGQVEN